MNIDCDITQHILFPFKLEISSTPTVTVSSNFPASAVSVVLVLDEIANNICTLTC